MATNKKIIFFIPTLAGGGAERVVSELSCNLPDHVKQYIVVFEDKVSYPHKSEIISLGVSDRTTTNLAVKFFQIVERFIRFRRVVKTIKPDVVLSFLQANIINVMVGMSFPKRRHKAILSERTATSKIELITKGLYGMINRSVMRFFYNRADKIIAVSEEIKRDLAGKFGISASGIEVIYNPVDSRKLNDMAAEDVGHPWFKEQIPIISTVGRLFPQKNQKDLISALAELRKSVDCRLVMIGEGELENDLKLLAASLNLENYVLFLGFQENPFKYVARSTIFTLPSLFEGFPNAMVEAMAVGCPVIASDCPTGPREILAPGSAADAGEDPLYARYGVLFRVGDVAAMVQGMKRLLTDRQLRSEYSRLGKERIVDFAVEKITDKYMGLLKI